MLNREAYREARQILEFEKSMDEQHGSHTHITVLHRDRFYACFIEPTVIPEYVAVGVEDVLGDDVAIALTSLTPWRLIFIVDDDVNMKGDMVLRVYDGSKLMPVEPEKASALRFANTTQGIG